MSLSLLLVPRLSRNAVSLSELRPSLHSLSDLGLKLISAGFQIPQALQNDVTGGLIGMIVEVDAHVIARGD